MSILDRARAELRELRGYSSARMEAGAAPVLLNANESPWTSLADATGGLNRYPDGRRPQPLMARLAAYYGVPEANVLLSRGSDDAIDLLVRGFCRAGEDAVIVSPPTFDMYAISARIQGAAVVEVPLAAAAGFAWQPHAVLAAADARVKLVFVCSPNNPTGNRVAREAVLAVADALQDRALVVVDEAYLEFTDEPGLADAVRTRDNLAVLRTLSKAHALAGARVGALIADAGVVELLTRLLPPYPVATASLRAAEAALTPEALAATRLRAAATRRERQRLAAALAGVAGVEAVLPSAANFLTVRFDDARAALARLAARGIAARDVTRYPGLGDALRISLGRPEDNDALLAALGGSRAAA